MPSVIYGNEAGSCSRRGDGHEDVAISTASRGIVTNDYLPKHLQIPSSWNFADKTMVERLVKWSSDGKFALGIGNARIEPMKRSPVFELSVRLTQLPHDCRMAIILIQTRGWLGKLKQRIKGTIYVCCYWYNRECWRRDCASLVESREKVRGIVRDKAWASSLERDGLELAMADDVIGELIQQDWLRKK